MLFYAGPPPPCAQVRTTFCVATFRFGAKAILLGTGAEPALDQGGTVEFEVQRGSWFVSPNLPVKIAAVPSVLGSYVGSGATEAPDTAKCVIRLNEHWRVVRKRLPGEHGRGSVLGKIRY